MLQNIGLLVLCLAGAAALVLAALSLFRRKNSDSALQALQSQIALLSSQLNERMKETSTTLHSSQNSMGQRLDHATSVVALLERKLGQLEESSKKIYALGEGLQELRDVLKSPKLRGNTGEFFLEELLRQILPSEHYRIQHSFKSGQIVDAVILVGDHAVSLDSKFPLESFVRMVQMPEADVDGRKREKKAFIQAIKRHADSIAEKYILTDEGTFDFALMYIPAENVYYETIIRDENNGEESSLYAYLLQKRVIPVSPHSLYAYLQVITLGLRGMRVEEHARQITQNIQRLSSELHRFSSEYSVLGKHLKNAAGSFEEGHKRLDKFQGKLDSLTEPEAVNQLPENSASL